MQERNTHIKNKKKKTRNTHFIEHLSGRFIKLIKNNWYLTKYAGEGINNIRIFISLTVDITQVC